MVGCLRKADFDAFGDIPPVAVCDLHLFGILALLPGERAEEGNDMSGDIILDSAAVPHRVDISQWGSNHSEMCVGLKSMLVILTVEPFCNFLT